MRTPEWLDEESGEEPDRRRPTWLIAAAIAPWLLVAGVLASGAPDDPSPAPATRSTAPAYADEASEDASDTPILPQRPAAGAAPHASETTSATEFPHAPPSDPAGESPRVAQPGVIDVTPLTGADDVPSEAAAVAVVVARSWLGDEPVAHLVTESVERVSAQSMIASVLAVIDSGDATSSVRRLAVPLADDGGGVAPTATPYPLPPPTLEPVQTRLHPAGDAPLVAEVAEAIRAAGLRDLEVRDVYTAEGWPLLADVRGPEGGERPAVWLTLEDGVPVVAGAARAGTRTDAWPDGRIQDQQDPPDQRDPEVGS